MNISIRGVRGSIPVTGPDTAKYGGNTSCVVVSEKNCLLILDGGSGMQKFYLPDPAIGRIDILLTHLHLDHIQGLGFFIPFYNPVMNIHIWGPVSNTSLHSRLSRYLSPPLFPVLLRDLPCKLTMHEIENSSFEIGPFKIESRYIIHPGPTVGFRVMGERSVFTYIPDHEPALGDSDLTDKKWISGFDLAYKADLLLHDAQYTQEQYKKKLGWGHSSMDDAVKFGAITEVKHLLLSHHDPSHTDEQLDNFLSEVKQRNNHKLNYELAAEGMKIELP